MEVNPPGRFGKGNLEVGGLHVRGDVPLAMLAEHFALPSSRADLLVGRKVPFPEHPINGTRRTLPRWKW